MFWAMSVYLSTKAEILVLQVVQVHIVTKLFGSIQTLSG